jgi:hypothetical protein
MNLTQRIRDAARDPQRRTQVCWRVVEGWAGTLPLLLIVLGVALEYDLPGHLLGFLVALALLGPLWEFLLYELLLEPKGKSGPYWERTPPAGKTFRYW